MEPADSILAASPDGETLCWAQELQPSKESDEEGTDDGKQRDKKRKEVCTSWQEVLHGRRTCYDDCDKASCLL